LYVYSIFGLLLIVSYILSTAGMMYSMYFCLVTYSLACILLFQRRRAGLCNYGPLSSVLLFTGLGIAGLGHVCFIPCHP
jgi:hypothetical protein